MTNQNGYLYTKEFAEKAGISVSAVTKLLRKGALKGEKKSGKWIIPESELSATAVKDLSDSTGSEASQPTDPAPVKSTGASYTVAEFAQMTFLTEKGVADWLKAGRLTGSQSAEGQWQVDAANCETDDIKRLLRSG